MITTIDKPHTTGRPTNETVQYRQELHSHNELIKTCHARVVTLEAKVLLQSNLIQRLILENKILSRDLNLLSRM
jgi:hypothetical protein